MLGRQSIDEVFKSMCSSRILIEQMEQNIGKKPDYSALRTLQSDPNFNELSDHVFSMLTPLSESEETALFCILRMRESEMRVLQQLHSKLQCEDSSRLILEADICGRRKIIDILTYSLKLNQQENKQGIPLTIEDQADELDTDAANMCQRIVQRRMNYLELISDGSTHATQQSQKSFTPKLSSINQRLAETAKNVERSLNSLGGNLELSLHDLDCSPARDAIPNGSDGDTERISLSSFCVISDTPTNCNAGLDSPEGNRFDLQCANSDVVISQMHLLSHSEAFVPASSIDQNRDLSRTFEVLTAIPQKSSPSPPPSATKVIDVFATAVPGCLHESSKSNSLPRHDPEHNFLRAVNSIAPFAMVKQRSHSDHSNAARSLSRPLRVSSQLSKDDVSRAHAVQTPKFDRLPVRKSDIQHSPHTYENDNSQRLAHPDDGFDLESYSQSKATVLKIRKSSIGQFSAGAGGLSPVRYIYADLVHSSNNSPSGGKGVRATPMDVVVTRPHIAHCESPDAIRSPRKYEAQITRLRSASVGRTPVSDAPLFRESYFPVMKAGSHLELRSPNERFNPASIISKHPPGWV
jgi:hypothetical protein